MKTKTIRPHKDSSTAIALDTIKLNKQILIFCSSKKGAESQAEKISKEKQGIKKEHAELAEQILKALNTPTKQCQRLSRCIEKGIAFHHAGLATKQRELIEDAFRNGIISTICSTPTLAAGLDLPAFRTIIRDTKRFGNRGMMPIPVLEFEQMAGRAGRPGQEDYGEAILIAKTENEIEYLNENYIHGEVENIYSKLAVEPVLRTYVLSLVSSNIIKNVDEVYSFFEKTFYAKQFGDLKKLRLTLNRMIVLLKKWNLLKKTPNEEENNKNKGKKQEKNSNENLFTNASELLKKITKKTNNEQLEVTELGRRVSELYLDPLTANWIIKNINKIKKEEQLQLIHMLSCTLEIRPLLRSGVKDFEQNQIFKEENNLIIKEEEFYEMSQEEYEDTIKTTRFFMDWINEYDEEKLLEKYNIRPGEITAKIQRMDWLLYATDELTRMTNQKELLKHVRNLRIQIKHGVKKELLPLLNFKNIGRVRARKLYNNKIRNIHDVKLASPQNLAQIIGNKTTINLKEQVGEKITIELKPQIKKIPKKHRKQTQLNEF